METAIVIATDQKYLPAACCAVISCRRAGRVTGPIFLVVSDAFDDSVEAARRFLSERRADAEIIRFNHDLSGYFVDGWVSPATYIRLHLDLILDRTWHRVLYLDADTRVLVPLWPLLRADLHGHVLGAVDNIRDHNHVARLSMAAGSRYFNCGVLLFEWPAILSSGLLAKSRRFAIENAHLCEWHDQDVLNKVFDGLWTPLHQRWNYTEKLAKCLPFERAFIKHYSYKYKPWGPAKPSYWIADAIWYRRTLRKSPWPDFAYPVAFGNVREGLRWLYQIRFSEGPSHRLSGDGLQLEPISET